MSTIRMKILFISLLLSTAVLPIMRASEMEVDGCEPMKKVRKRARIEAMDPTSESEEMDQRLKRRAYTEEEMDQTSEWKDHPSSIWSNKFKCFYDIFEIVSKEEEGDPKNEKIMHLCLNGLRIRQGLGFNRGIVPVLHANWSRCPLPPYKISDEPVQKKIMEDFIRLIELGADVNSVTYHQKWSLLMSAARNNILKLKGVEFLLKNNIEVDLKDFEGMTALMWAVWESSKDSHLKVIDLLLQNNANPNSKRNKGETVYMVADRKETRNPKVIKLLLDYGAVPNLKSDKDEEV